MLLMVFKNAFGILYYLSLTKHWHLNLHEGLFNEPFCSIYLWILQGCTGKSFAVSISLCSFVWFSSYFEFTDVVQSFLGFRYMDYVFGNETEARTFSKVHGWEVIVVWHPNVTVFS